MKITLNDAAEWFRSRDQILILCHSSPDGDTFGSGTALCMGLRRLGKRAMVRCSDPVGKRFQFLFDPMEEDDFAPQAVCAVDIADEKLLGEPLFSQWSGKVELCIDHHPSNTGYAKLSYVAPSAAATCEIIYDLLGLLGCKLDLPMATALYTGISTDTGCFRYINVTPRTHRIAANLLELGVESAKIDRLMFETKSRDRMRLEQMVLNTLEFFCDNRVAVIRITQKMIAETAVGEEDTEGLASLPRQIEGVFVGVTLREKTDGTVKVSLRALQPLNASEICAQFGGGGHPGAAGCSFDCGVDEARDRIVAGIRAYLETK